MHRKSGVWAAVAVLAVCAACAPKQRIPVSVSPQPATLYLDGQALEMIPNELVLRSDRAHVLFFKSDGFRPERVVLESREMDGRARLTPDAVHVRLVPASHGGREVTIEPTDDE